MQNPINSYVGKYNYDFKRHKICETESSDEILRGARVCSNINIDWQFVFVFQIVALNLEHQ